MQVAGKERESQLSNQFRDIATIVMQKTINPETQRPYTISMIERLMHEIHFAVDPHSSSKKQVITFLVFRSCKWTQLLYKMWTVLTIWCCRLTITMFLYVLSIMWTVLTILNPYPICSFYHVQLYYISMGELFSRSSLLQIDVLFLSFCLLKHQPFFLPFLQHSKLIFFPF